MRLILSLVWIPLAAFANAQSVETLIQREMNEGRFARALRRADQAIGELEGESEARERLEELRARCLFEVGDYPACESALRGLLERGPSSPERRRNLETRLAQVLSLQGAQEEALALAESTLKGGASPELRRLIIRILLEERRYAEVGPHARELLSSRPDDAFALFARGVSAAKTGSFDAAIEDLKRSARDAGLRRDALFELALAYAALGRPRAALVELSAILSEDPFDAEACHQLGRQLLRVKQARTAARVLRYFETLKGALGASSRDHHLAAGGHPAEAWLERAERWERVGAMRRAVDAVLRAGDLGAGDPAVMVRVAEFWRRQGLLAEAESALRAVPASSARAGTASDDQVVSAALEKLEAFRETLGAERGPLAAARNRLGTSRWPDARGPLENLLRGALRQSDVASADGAARLLLARDPSSRLALEYLAARTRSPELIIAHLYYLTRLCRIDEAAPRWRGELEETQRLLSGE